MLAQYPKKCVAHDVAILKWDIPYYLPCVSFMMWQIKIGIFHFISHLPKKPCFLMWQYFFGIYRYIPFFFIHPWIVVAEKKWDRGYPISHPTVVARVRKVYP